MLLRTLLLTLFVYSTVRAQPASQPLMHLETGAHLSQIRMLEFTPDSQTLISAGNDQVVRLWDVRNPAAPVLSRSIRLDRAAAKPGEAVELFGDVSPDGKWLALTLPEGIFLLRLQTAQVVALLKCDRPRSPRFSPSGRFLAASARDGDIRVWDMRDQRLVTHRGPRPLTTMNPERFGMGGHNYGVIDWLKTPTALQLVATSRTKCHFWQWRNPGWGSQGSFPSKVDSARLASPYLLQDLACSPDGKWIVMSSDDFASKKRAVTLWTASGQFLRTLRAAPGYPSMDVGWTPDSQSLLIADGHYGVNRTSVESLQDGREICSVPNTVFGKPAVSPNNRVAASAASPAGSAVLWDPATGRRFATLDSAGSFISKVAFSKDGQTLGWSHDGRSRTFRPTGEFNLGDFQRQSASQRQQGVSWLPTPNPGPWSWEIKDQHVIIKKNGSVTTRISQIEHGGVRTAIFLPEKSQIITAGFVGVRMFDAHTGRLLHVFTGTSAQIATLAVSPDRRTLVGGGIEETVVLWDLENPSKLVPPLVSFFFPVEGSGYVAWTPEGYYTATPGAEKYINWAISKGKDQSYDIVGAWQYRKLLRRPSIVELVPSARSTSKAIALAAQYENHRAEAMVNVASDQSRLAIPAAIIDSPRNGTIIPDDYVRLKGSLRATGSLPIIELRITANKRPVVVHECQDIVKQAGQSTSQPIRFELEVPLLPNGPNTIEVSAATQAATSKPVSLEVVSQIKSVTKPNLYLLGIGVADYEQADMKLAFPDDDVAGVTAAFQSQEGRFYEKVNVDELVNDEVTERNIRRSLKQLSQNVTQHDVAIVMVSGHGHADDRGEFYFCPHDFDPDEPDITGVPWVELTGPLTKLPCKVLLCIDTCYSAGVLEQKSNDLRGKSTARRRRSAFENAMSDLRSVDPALVVLTSSTDQQESFERDSWGHGAFALSLVEVLTGKHNVEGSRISLPADINKDRFLEISEIDSYVTARVKELTNGRQQPVTDRGRAPSFPIGVAQ